MSRRERNTTPELELPEDVEALHSMVRRMANEHEQELAARDATIERLTEELRQAIARRFGARSERMTDAQLGLFNEAEAYADTDDEADAGDESVTVPAHARRRGKRAALPEHLPRVDVLHELPEAERMCPNDGTVLERFAEDVSEQLDIVPATIQVIRHRRAKYRCGCCGEHVMTAPMPAQPIPKSQASPGLLAYVATAKYVDALPLYRQVKGFERIGIVMARHSLARWMLACGDLVRPLMNLYRETLLAQCYVHMDETTVQVLKEPGRAASAKSSLWCQVSGQRTRPVILFDYESSRSGDVPKRLLGDYSGTLHTDGYEGYAAVVRDKGLRHVHCFAHARRYFVEGLKALGLNPSKLPPKTPPKARHLLKGLRFIRTLYTLERRVKDRPPDERLAVRQNESRPVFDALCVWAKQIRPRVPPKAPLGKALAYLENHIDGLSHFLDDPSLDIDNNRAENAIRPFVVGRKNWLFSDTPAGATASARMYSLIETAKANGLEPYAYLRYVFTHLPQANTVEDVEALLAWNIDPDRLRHTQP